MSDSGSDTGAFLAGFVIGGLVGAAVALIMAPQSGEQTRAQLAARGQSLRESGGMQVRHYRETYRPGHFGRWREQDAEKPEEEVEPRIVLNREASESDSAESPPTDPDTPERS